MMQSALEVEETMIPARARFFAGTVPSSDPRPPVAPQPGPEYLAFTGILREVLASAAAAGCELAPRSSQLLGTA